MALAQLIYVSRRSRGVLVDDLRQLVARSAERNRRRSVTGVLMCRGHNLMQLIEGELADITALFEHIRKDPRHGDVKCLLCKHVNKRLFPEWDMELADLDNKGIVDPRRLQNLIDDVRAQTDTGDFAVETRVLLADFRRQVTNAAA